MEDWQVIAIVTGAAVVLPLAVLGVFLLKGKGAMFLAGYNTMSEEKKSRYNEKALCKFMGIMILLISACVAAMFVGIVILNNAVIVTGVALTAAATIFALIYINTSSKIKTKEQPK